MEDTNPSPLLLESVDSAVSDDVQTTELPSPESDDNDTLWRMIFELEGSIMDDSSFSHSEVDELQTSVGDGPVYGFPASLYPNAGNGLVADGFPTPFYCQAGNIPSQEQPESPPVISRRNPNFSSGGNNITCITYAATLCSIVWFSMAFGVYKNGTTAIGMGSSVLIQPNRFFMEKINVEQPFKSDVGPIVYGFSKQPSLDIISSWSELHCASLQANSLKGWMYFLNEGSQINISYSSVSSSKLLLTISRGSDGYGHDYGDGYCYASGQCLYDQSGPNTTISWNIIQGNGVIQQNILLSGNYYINVENLNLKVEEVQLNIRGRALIYDTDEAHYVCILAQGRCVFHVSLYEENHVVLSTPQFNQETSNGEWRVKLSYGPRWITFFGGIVVMNGMMLIGIQLWKKHVLFEFRLSRAHVL